MANRPIYGSQVQNLMFALRQFLCSEFRFPAGLGKVGKPFFLPLCAVVVGECELRINVSVNAVLSLINLYCHIATLDFNRFIRFTSDFRFPTLIVLNMPLKVKLLQKTQ